MSNRIHCTESPYFITVSNYAKGPTLHYLQIKMVITIYRMQIALFSSSTTDLVFFPNPSNKYFIFTLFLYKHVHVIGEKEDTITLLVHKIIMIHINKIIQIFKTD